MSSPKKDHGKQVKFYASPECKAWWREQVNIYRRTDLSDLMEYIYKNCEYIMLVPSWYQDSTKLVLGSTENDVGTPLANKSTCINKDLSTNLKDLKEYALGKDSKENPLLLTEPQVGKNHVAKQIIQYWNEKLPERKSNYMPDMLSRINLRTKDHGWNLNSVGLENWKKLIDHISTLDFVKNWPGFRMPWLLEKKNWLKVNAGAYDNFKAGDRRGNRKIAKNLEVTPEELAGFGEPIGKGKQD